VVEESEAGHLGLKDEYSGAKTRGSSYPGTRTILLELGVDYGKSRSKAGERKKSSIGRFMLV
jgi:hypothetical protein